MKVVFLALLLTACATSKTKLSDQAKEVRVLEHAKGHGCAVLDKVTGVNDKGSEDLAQNHVRNLAAKAGANAVHFDETIRNGAEIKVKATIYTCD